MGFFNDFLTEVLAQTDLKFSTVTPRVPPLFCFGLQGQIETASGGIFPMLLHVF